MERYQAKAWDRNLGPHYGLNDTMVDLVYDVVLTICKANRWPPPSKSDVVITLKAEGIVAKAREVIDERCNRRCRKGSKP